MLAGERELRRVVVKDCTGPLCGGVTSFASLRETGCDVVRARRLLEVRQVAGNAGGAESRKLAADMTRCACHRSMFPSQGEFSRVVIENRTRPLDSRMAGFTGLRKASRRMVGIGCFLEVWEVAGCAGGAESRKLAADVAGRACDRGVFACQRELRCVVIEDRAGPLDRRMAGFTSLREPRRDMVRICRLLEIGQVAR